MTGYTGRWPRPSATSEGEPSEEEKSRRASFWQSMVYLTSLGWLTALPIALTILLGRFLDNRYGAGNFWTLVLLGVGLVIAGIEVYLAMHRALERRSHD